MPCRGELRLETMLQNSLKPRVFRSMFSKSHICHTKSHSDFLFFFEFKIKSHIAIAIVIPRATPKAPYISTLCNKATRRTKLKTKPAIKHILYFIIRRVSFFIKSPLKQKMCYHYDSTSLSFLQYFLFEVSVKKSLKCLAVASLVLKLRPKTA